ncbi:MAG: DUF1549 domain-containing protein, partial [Planctomycetota bacterium]
MNQRTPIARASSLALLLVLALAARSRAAPKPSASWWSLQPLDESVEVPASLEPEGWARNEIDRFVLRRLREKGLRPSPAASPRALVRRLSIDLLGLPADAETVRMFEREASDDAYERLIDRFLSSPHYGERWGRHWLDVVRYGESDGFERNKTRNDAYHYRDWVIRALNEDMPYDEFARKQIAGDLTHPGAEGAAAVGFLVAGVHNTTVGSSREMRLLARQDELEEIAGAIGQTFLGLTINCARCHDHKFDPIPTRDYYRFISAIDGVRHGSRDVLVENRAKEIAALEQRVRDLESGRAARDQAVRVKILKKREAKALPKPPRLPEALIHWTFDDANFRDASGQVSSTPAGNPRIEGGALVVDGRSYLKSVPLEKDILEKTLVATVVLGNLGQRGGGVMTIANPKHFDSIVYGEKDPKRWMPGSEGFRRTEGLGGPEEKEAQRQPVQIAITYAKDGTITGYRNGQRYGKPYKKGSLTHYKAGESYVLFGLRHEPPGGNQFLSARILDARLFDRTLNSDEVAALAGVQSEFVSDEELVATLDPAAKKLREETLREIQQSKERRRSLQSGQKSRFFTVSPGTPGVVRVHVRGSVKEYGDEVAPGGIGSVGGVDANFALAKNAPDGQRRKKLADWIGSPRNPLLARVIVNRVWHYHFGRGLVKTPSDLGYNGGKPSHPDLLEWL